LILLLGNSFGYFSSDDQDIVVLNEIKRVLKPGGRVVIDLTDGDYMRENYSEKSWEWIDDTTFVVRERQLSEDNARLISREIVTVTTQGVIRDQFYQERLYSREDLYQLLQQIGFLTTEKPNVSLNAKSKRNEDLGMMEHRMIITGTKEEKASVLHVESSATLHLEESQKPHVTVLLGDPTQRCFGKLNNQWNQEDLDTQHRLLEALKAKNLSFTALSNHGELLHQLVTNPPQFVFNLCDEGWNNDALKELHVPALLEMLNIPFSGAGPNCLAYCYDKGMVNRSAQAIGVETPKEITFVGEDMEELESKVKAMGYPAFVKPIKGDNSLGITTRSVVHSFEEVKAYIQELEQQGLGHVLIQEYLEGDEYGVGVIGNPEHGFQFLPIIKVDFKRIMDRQLPPILGYESKWDPSSPYWSEITYEVAQLPLQVEKRLKQDCLKLWDRFSCRDYCRFDFRASKDGTLKLLEVNPNPGWCWDGKFAYMGKLQGTDYATLLEKILEASWKRLGFHH
jgi:D-alanine-D-alanine ligase